MTRFEAIVNGDPGMLPHPDGSYVLYSEAQGLEDQLAEAIEVNTAAYMLGVEAGKKDAAMLYKARVEALEWLVREAEPHILDIVKMGGFHSASAKDLHGRIMAATEATR